MQLHPIPYKVCVHQKWGTELVLMPTHEGARSLAQNLIEVIETGGQWRQALGGDGLQAQSSQWTLYWKIRDSGCRALLAHPEAHEWVATLALTKEVLMTLTQRLESGAGFVLDEVAELMPPSNFHLVVVRACS